MDKVRRLLRMSALRQAAMLSAVFLALTLLAGLALSALITEDFDAAVSADLRQYTQMLTRSDGDLATRIDLFNMNDFGPTALAGFQGADGRISGPFKPDVFKRRGEFALPEADLLRTPIGSVFEHFDDHDEADSDDIVWDALVSQTDQGMVIVAVPDYYSDDFLPDLPGNLVRVGAGVSLLTLLLGLFSGLSAQKRLDNIQDGLRRVGAGELSTRIAPHKAKDDLDDLAVQVDETTARLERSVGQLRHLSTNIAHDLKTPVARLRADLERATTLPDPRPALEDAITETDRIITTFDTLMRLSKINSGKGRAAFTPLSLDAPIRAAFETFAPVLEDDGHIVTTDISPTARITGDKAMLVQALANLMVNAGRYGGERTEITLYAKDRTIGVRDTGPGIAEADKVRVLDPMVRLDAARHTEGVGLGLAIVKAVADLHEAELKLSDNSPTGLDVSLCFRE